MTTDQWDFDNQAPHGGPGDDLFGQTPSGPPSQARDWSGAPTAGMARPASPPPTVQQPMYPPPVVGSQPAQFGYADPVVGPAVSNQLAPKNEPESKPPVGWGWRALVAFVAGGSMVAGGFAVAQINDNGSVVAEAAAPTTPPIVNAGSSDIDAELEPVAFVAALLGPSVVQIDTNLGLGSGIVIDPTTVITNNHVIEGATTVSVRLSNGGVIQGQIVGSDARTDVAVISVPEGSNLPPAELALGEELSVGQLTVAIGSPFELQQTVTAGIISALDRPIQMNEATINAMIQTDTAINPGNSGGALADRQGRVIGMNTLIQTDGSSNTNIGLGFATPIDTVMKVVERIISGGDLTPGFMGVAGTPDDGGLPGVVIREVTADSGADDAGVLLGDRVLRVDGAPVSTVEELAGLVQSSFPGDTVDLELIRDGQEITITVVLGGR